VSSPSLPRALDAETDAAVIVDAAYFVIRALRNRLRNYPRPEVSPESPGRAFDLAGRALAQIQAAEAADLAQIAPEQILAYIELLEGLSRSEFGEVAGTQEAGEAQTLLEQLRADHPFE
jgi:hypothetical protein